MSAAVSVDAPLLAVRDLAVRRGDREVLSGIELRLRRGEVTALLGPNGAGKSTLLRALSGTVRRSAGIVELRGRMALGAQEPALARRSVRANVELALAWWGVPRAERRARAEQALRELGIEQLAGRSAHTLSGGEARRAHLARVLAVRPNVLLLDEPFAGLDPLVRGELLYDLAELLRDPSRATLVVLHDRAEAWALADQVAVLLDGALAACGPPASVLEEPPSPQVARFLGFVGRVADGEGELLVRPGQVALDLSGPLVGRVARKVPIEDGMRLELELEAGGLVAISEAPGPAVGERVRVRVRGGVRFVGGGT
jgi:ABC-type sulfate/molybdate transport systems ATPase subunit